jgi:hypothetical protein
LHGSNHLPLASSLRDWPLYRAAALLNTHCFISSRECGLSLKSSSLVIPFRQVTQGDVNPSLRFLVLLDFEFFSAEEVPLYDRQTDLVMAFILSFPLSGPRVPTPMTCSDNLFPAA